MNAIVDPLLSFPEAGLKGSGLPFLCLAGAVATPLSSVLPVKVIGQMAGLTGAS